MYLLEHLAWWGDFVARRHLGQRDRFALSSLEGGVQSKTQPDLKLDAPGVTIGRVLGPGA